MERDRKTAMQRAERPQRRAERPQRQAERPQRQAGAETKQTPAAEGKPARKKTRVRRMNASALRVKLLAMLGVVAALILTFVIFFKINDIEVTNTALQAEDGSALTPYYTSEEIIAASGIEMGDNLLTINKASVAARIRAQLPYIDEVQVKRSFPGGVVILVTEFAQSYGICDVSGTWWLVSRDGSVLEQTDAQTAASHICVSGVAIAPPEPGEEIRPIGAEGADETELASQKEAVIQTLKTLEAHPQIAKHIATVDVTSSYDIVLWYGAQYEVRLGTADELTYKFAYLQGVLDEFVRENRSYLSGVIDITFSEGRHARFRPFG